jgi:hypothetical protein
VGVATAAVVVIALFGLIAIATLTVLQAYLGRDAHGFVTARDRRGRELPDYYRYELPDRAGFEWPDDPDYGFTILSRRDAPQAPRTPSTVFFSDANSAQSDADEGFVPISQTYDPSAYCRLSGRQVADCTCDRCVHRRTGRS